jgi:hypothetical protein
MMAYCWLMKHTERPTCFQLQASLEDFLKTLLAFV